MSRRCSREGWGVEHLVLAMMTLATGIAAVERIAPRIWEWLA